jgi:nicotinate (nicotinamide) nucleotide adenylyltransferase
MPKPIVFFGASMNPPTLAHRAMVDHMIKLRPEALIVLAPVYKHIYREKSPLMDYRARVKMTRLAFQDLILEGKALVSEVERLTVESTGSSVGTVDVLAYMKSHPESVPEGEVDHISLILGGDSYEDFFAGKWKNAEGILASVDKIYGFDRGSEHRLIAHHSKVEIESTRGAITDPKIQAISSTRIRASLAYAESGVLHPDVLNYMKEIGFEWKVE